MTEFSLREQMEKQRQDLFNIAKNKNIKEQEIEIKKRIPIQIGNVTKIETAINKLLYNKDWEELFNDIVDSPSPEGKLRYDFPFGKVDLKDFEDYIKSTLLLKNLKVVLKYKSSRLQSKMRGYLQGERR